MQDAIEAQLIRQVNIITEKIGGIAVIGARVDEIAHDVAEVKERITRQNGSVARHEKALTEVIAWQKAHNADHEGSRDERIASAGRKVEWVKTAAQFIPGIVAIIALAVSCQPHPGAQAAPAPTSIVTPAPSATFEDLRGGGGPEPFSTPTPIVPRMTPTPDQIIEIAPGGMMATPSRFGQTEWDIDGTYYHNRPLNVRTCTSTNRCYLRQIAANVSVPVFRMIRVPNGDLWLAIKDSDREYVAFVIGETIYGTLVCAGGVCVP